MILLLERLILYGLEPQLAPRFNQLSISCSALALASTGSSLHYTGLCWHFLGLLLQLQSLLILLLLSPSNQSLTSSSALSWGSIWLPQTDLGMLNQFLIWLLAQVSTSWFAETWSSKKVVVFFIIFYLKHFELQLIINNNLRVNYYFKTIIEKQFKWYLIYI